MDTASTQENFRAMNGKRQVLIVDDEEINREILGQYLCEDYDVLYAEDGAQALDVIREHKDTLSLILLDLLMPVMSGIDVLKQLREDSDLSHIPVIVLTADQESEIECLKLGAIDFIPKPYPQVGVALARVQRTIEFSEDRRIIQVTERDSLTGLYNKEYFFGYAEQFDRLHKNTETDAVILDVNHFHVLNERYGKTFGDTVLQNIGNQIQKELKGTGGIACRGEADTFLVYCPHREDYEELLKDISAGVTVNDTTGNRVRLRMGVYSKTDKLIDIERRFDRAKTAVDSVRGNYSKAIGIYDEKLIDQEVYAEQLIEEFDTALESGQFKVYYQPKFDIRPKKPLLCSAEALVRWVHPDQGMISPGVFIPLFENNGLIQKLDVYVWQEAARQIREWKDTLGYIVPVSVNVSRVDLYDPNIVEILTNIVKSNGISPEDLYLEVTESAYTNDTAQIIDIVKELQNIGFFIEMDDFGTGYSSLNMISQLPINAMKLDMQFVRTAFSEGGNTRMLEVIIDIAKYLNVPVVAEGVETEEQLRSLKAMDCDIVQGFYFSKAIPAEYFETFIREGKTDREEADAAAKAEEEAAASQTIDELIQSQMRAKSQTFIMEGNHSHPLGEERRHTKKGISLRLMSIIFTIAAILAAAALFWASSEVNKGYSRMEQASDRYITAQQAATNMEASSDYLTDRVRSFAVTGDIQYLKDFFEEVEVTQRREQALADLEILLQGSDNTAYEHLAEALHYSNELVTQENQSMLARIKAGNYDPADIPEIFMGMELSPEDQDLSFEELIARSQELVFDDYYMEHKTLIRENVRLCTEELIQESSMELEQATNKMASLLRIQAGLIVFLLFVVMCLVIFIFTQVRRPLSQMVEQMRTQLAVSPTGAEELRFVTRTYNDILLENKKAHAQLTYEASHDALTGLYNRGAYDMLLTSVDTDHIALILVDVDNFKGINDTYGHDVGDLILKKVADILLNSFRSVDVICRIGGDEFVVIMTRANSTMRQIVYNKILNANNTLQNPQDGLPPVSLSVGAAFADRKNPQGNIFKDADTALYEAKNAGKGRCEIY